MAGWGSLCLLGQQSTVVGVPLLLVEVRTSVLWVGTLWNLSGPGQPGFGRIPCWFIEPTVEKREREKEWLGKREDSPSQLEKSWFLCWVE